MTENAGMNCESIQVYLNIKRNYHRGMHCMYALKACLLGQC